MANPIIMAVDDDRAVLGAITRDLKQHFGREFRVIGAGSGQQGLETLRSLKARDAEVAMLVSDQRMPEMLGTEFLAEAKELYPGARKVLLTAYADTEAAISAINEVGLDHYLMKPWDPPEQKLYPVLDDILYTWHATAEAPYDGVRVLGTQFSAACHRTKHFLAGNNVPYRWVDIDKDASMRAVADGAGGPAGRLPVVIYPDGKTVREPSAREIAETLGIQTEARKDFYELIVIGGGPAGLAAGVYGAAEGLSTCVIEKDAPGGQAGTSSRIENYLGFPNGISGGDLSKRAADQARRLGTELLLTREVKSVRVEEPYRVVTLADGGELRAYSVILAPGMTVRRLDIPGEERFAGAGIYYGASLTEGANFKGEQMFVIGGANSAGQGAMWFSRFAEKLTMVVRAEDLVQSMSQYLIDRIEAADNIELLTRTRVVEARGDQRLEQLVIEDIASGERRTVDAHAVFVFIGSKPHSAIVRDLVEMDGGGFILTGLDLMKGGERPRGFNRDPYLYETSVPGIFAVGDVRAGSTKRVNAAIGEGSIAVKFAWEHARSV
ncbi:MAG: FAD-dependent oxidoreductase [Myxococcales bacterium]|nr:FAD-dependent oxidoreductase [Myxococcales bacterium]